MSGQNIINDIHSVHVWHSVAVWIWYVSFMLCSFLFSVWPLLYSLSISIFTYCVFLTIFFFYYYFMLSLSAWVIHKISNSPFHLLLFFLANAHAGFVIEVLNAKDAFFTTAMFIAQISSKRMLTECIALASLVCPCTPLFLSSASCVWGGCPVSGCCKAILFTPGWKPLLWKLAD